MLGMPVFAQDDGGDGGEDPPQSIVLAHGVSFVRIEETVSHFDSSFRYLWQPYLPYFFHLEQSY